MASASAPSQRQISISYSLSIPSTAKSDSTLDPNPILQIPVSSSPGGLVKALDNARAGSNELLTRWKGAIGELEKEKEARAVRAAEEKRMAEKQAKKEAARRADQEAASDEDEEDEDDEEEAE